MYRLFWPTMYIYIYIYIYKLIMEMNPKLGSKLKKNNYMIGKDNNV